MNKIFCTSYITPETKQRYLDWFEYYQKMFPDCELIAYNDGKIIDVDFPYPVYEFDTHLGRISCGLFPGWKRSFMQGLKDGCNIHIESDLYIFKSAVDKCMEHFNSPGYYSGYCNKYFFMETGFQIINDDNIKQKVIDLLTEDIDDFWHVPEINLGNNAKPIYLLQGTRETDISSINLDNYDYLAQSSPEIIKNLEL